MRFLVNYLRLQEFCMNSHTFLLIQFSVSVVVAMSQDSGNENCAFCKIQSSSSTELFYEDDQFIAFKDIRPATPHHYLIIPRKHMKNASFLEPRDVLLVKKMVEIGTTVLEQQQADVSEARFGFHWPPFRTIEHLHLHVISPVSQMGFISRFIFRPDSYWFMTASTLIDKLEKSQGSDKL